ncbi:MAG: hypothetical protein HYV26_07950 [Candidatus Hydrogenedentes bacterium]|nr:hypothetical protein [Candidatus Hydrogenedentota bacterium]
MKQRSPQRNVTSRIIRKGDPVPNDWEWEGTTPKERIEAVWELTLEC